MVRSERFTNYYNELASIGRPVLFAVGEREESLYRAMNYSLGSVGKLLRPVLVLAVGELLDLPRTELTPFAHAVETLHTASLVHDDLPELDNDALRRGKPTCHVVFGTATALLAGDALISRSFSLAAQSPREALALVSLLTRTFDELCLGQALEFESSVVIEDFDSVVQRQQLKTGAMFRACVEGPLLLARDLSEERTEKLRLFAIDLGMLFQFADDILDIVGVPEETGKEGHSDERRQLATLPSLVGLEDARLVTEEVAVRAKTALSTFGEKGWFLEELVESVISRVRA